MVNDKSTVEYNQARYEEHIKEWHTFNTQKKNMISRMSNESDTDYEKMEF